MKIYCIKRCIKIHTNIQLRREDKWDLLPRLLLGCIVKNQEKVLYNEYFKEEYDQFRCVLKQVLQFTIEGIPSVS